VRDRCLVSPRKGDKLMGQKKGRRTSCARVGRKDNASQRAPGKPAISDVWFPIALERAERKREKRGGTIMLARVPVAKIWGKSQKLFQLT